MLLTQSQNNVYQDYMPPKIRRNTSKLRPRQQVYFNMRMGIIDIDVRGEMIVGRFEDGTTRYNIDLSEFEASKFGVSRKHSKLIRGVDGQLFLIDLWSTNGTYLNEDKLEPYMMYELDNGDVVRLGDFIIHIMFG